MRLWLALVGLVAVGCAAAADRSTPPQPVADGQDAELLAFDEDDPEFDESCRSRHGGVVDGKNVCLCATDWDCLGEEHCEGAVAETFDYTGVCRSGFIATGP